MDAHTEEDAPSTAQKFIFSRPEERQIRRRLIWTAAALDAIAIALIIPLCVGGWAHKSMEPGGSVNSGDAHLVTWSAAFRRSDSQRESTFALTWFMSSCCFEEMYVDKKYALAGCIRRTPGSAFDLQGIKSDLEIKLKEQKGDKPWNAPEEGYPELLTNVDFAGARTVSTLSALSSYGIYLALSIGTWFFQVIAKRNGVMLNGPQLRILVASHALSLVALLVASTVLTAAAYKANAALRNFEEAFPYHAVGSSFKAMAWCASISHLLGFLTFAASAKMWRRLQNLDLYPPEPEEEIEPTRRHTESLRPHRPPRPEQAPVHREVDPNVVDDELPPYSRLDPNEGGVIAGGETGRLGDLERPVELAHLRDVRNPPLEDQDNNPAPAYELHHRPSNQRASRQT